MLASPSRSFQSAPILDDIDAVGCRPTDIAHLRDIVSIGEQGSAETRLGRGFEELGDIVQHELADVDDRQPLGFRQGHPFIRTRRKYLAGAADHRPWMDIEDQQDHARSDELKVRETLSLAGVASIC